MAEYSEVYFVTRIVHDSSVLNLFIPIMLYELTIMHCGKLSGGSPPCRGGRACVHASMTPRASWRDGMALTPMHPRPPPMDTHMSGSCESRKEATDRKC